MRIMRPSRRMRPTSLCTLVTRGTCGIKDAQPSLFGFSGNGFGYAVGRKNHRCTFWNIGKLIYKDGAAGAQAFNYRSVVYDFMAYVNRSAVDGERSLNDGNGAGNAGAKPRGCARRTCMS